jgi:hypothetical protein
VYLIPVSFLFNAASKQYQAAAVSKVASPGIRRPKKVKQKLDADSTTCRSAVKTDAPKLSAPTPQYFLDSE